MSGAAPAAGERGLDRIAVVSDVHGNVTAFTAVLGDIRGRGIDTILNLGDIAGKGPRGSECVRMTREHCAVTVRGNWDDFLPKPPDPAHSPTLGWWRDELTRADRDWLLGLPRSHDLRLSGRRVRLLHASAESVYMRVFPRHTDGEFDGMFEATELTGSGPSPDLVCYGDIHYAYIRHRNGRTLVNAGSVGNSLDEPTASYLILEGALDSDVASTIGVQFVRVPYDVEAEIGAAATLGMPELDAYATELRTAVYQR